MACTCLPPLRLAKVRPGLTQNGIIGGYPSVAAVVPSAI